MSNRFQINQQIGEYRVTGFLGAGGMGEVYCGEHSKIGRLAAIKVLLPDVADANFKTRFFNEARLQAGLQHPHIATLYDFQETNGQLFIFMEFVDGESLEDLIKNRAFSVDETLEVFAAICEAIAYIHRHGVIHRDIKSQNIKLTAGGTVKLLDFGIAKDSASHGLTQTGGVIGTPHYLAPEQLDGKPATAQGDVWALGVLLYEMLTNQMPFSGDNLTGLILQIMSVNYAAPEELNPAIPREVAAIVKKCLKKDVSSRYQTADELLEDVKRVLRGEAKPSAIAGLKKTFGLVSKPAPNDLPPTVISNYAPDYSNSESDYSSDYAPAKANKLPVGLIAGAVGATVILLSAVVGIAFWAFSGNAVVVANTNDKTQIVVQSTGKNAGRKIRVDLDEGQAQVSRGGQNLGNTPLDLDASDGDKIDLTLHRDGYEDKNVKIEVAGGKKVYTFSLKQK